MNGLRIRLRPLPLRGERTAWVAYSGHFSVKGPSQTTAVLGLLFALADLDRAPIVIETEPALGSRRAEPIEPRLRRLRPRKVAAKGGAA